jgi:hypothetical protein
MSFNWLVSTFLYMKLGSVNTGVVIQASHWTNGDKDGEITNRAANLFRTQKESAI